MQQGFESRKAAEDALRAQRVHSKGMPVKPESKPVRYVVIGSVSSQKNKVLRKKRPKTPHEWNKLLVKEGLSIHQGKFLKDADHGTGRLVVGGYDVKKLDQVTAAHENAQGGPYAIARPVKPQGNGPDKFDKEDPVEISDIGQAELSASDGNPERETWEDPKNPAIQGADVDPLLASSVEDRVLPAPDWLWDEVPTETRKGLEEVEGDPKPVEEEPIAEQEELQSESAERDVIPQTTEDELPTKLLK